MNTDKVVEMIDAICEGNMYEMEVPVSEDSIDGLAISFGECVVFRPNSNVTSSTINDPRTARELAGALLAFAKRQELGENVDRRDVGEICVLAAGTSNVEFPSVNDHAEIKAGRSTREEWYRRNVKRMTLETLKRNKQDLQEILGDSTNPHVSEDIHRAINLIDDELYKRDQG